MKFMMTFTADPKAAPPTPEQLAAIGEYSYRMIQSGVIVLTGGVIRHSNGVKVRLEDGKFSVTDGPFAETKELIDGFAIVKVASQEEAIKHCSNFMKLAGEGPRPGTARSTGCAAIAWWSASTRSTASCSSRRRSRHPWRGTSR